MKTGDEKSERLNLAFLTIGCRANQSDTSRMISSLPDNARVADIHSGDCDIVVINTCAVTSRAEADGRRAVRHAKRHNPEARIIVTGCASQVEPEKWLEMPGVDAVIGITERDDLASLMDSLPLKPESRVSMPSGGVHGPTPLAGHKSRPFLKIQDGCSRGCAYCIVPQARGPERSRPPEMILDDIRALAEAGYREIVLTGVHLGQWGTDLGSGFDGLLDALDRITADVRLRLSSIEPMDLTPGLVRRILRHRLLCPHLHIPLQSGDDTILEKMGRGHTVPEFASIVEAAVETCPDMALGTDIMVGFPGEDEVSFRKTVEFLENQPFTYFHIFPYSPRRGTPAAGMPGRPPGPSVRERMRFLKKLDKSRREAFLKANAGVPRPCLIEIPEGDSKRLIALSDNYIRLDVNPSLRPIDAGNIVSLCVDITSTGFLWS